MLAIAGVILVVILGLNFLALCFRPLVLLGLLVAVATVFWLIAQAPVALPPGAELVR